MIVIGCSHGRHIAGEIAKKAKRRYAELLVERFPDNELHIKFKAHLVKNKRVVLIQSFYDDIDSCLIEVMFAARTAKELGASSVTLMAPYFPYMRQDKMFDYGEVVSVHVLGEILSKIIDNIYILDPHLHREKTLGHIFSVPAHKLSANPIIAEYIRTVKKPLIVGPDWESYKWARKTAEIADCESTILLKDRHTARNVDVKFQENVNAKGRNIILIDDMISTGNTLIKTIKKLKKLGAAKITCIAVHGIFVENALDKIKRTGAKVFTCNSIPNKAAKIDVSELFAEKIDDIPNSLQKYGRKKKR
ncbi:ribose-phosphate diphosphokinase [Candidatus Woesearchaeota archaeon]|nr:ribose-phosphate diphosphokinase [Candidatus Woesearchaeota archaeon]